MTEYVEKQKMVGSLLNAVLKMTNNSIAKKQASSSQSMPMPSASGEKGNQKQQYSFFQNFYGIAYLRFVAIKKTCHLSFCLKYVGSYDKSISLFNLFFWILPLPLFIDFFLIHFWKSIPLIFKRLYNTCPKFSLTNLIFQSLSAVLHLPSPET